MTDVLQIANFFIQKGTDSGKPISPMKLQKLLYYSYGWWWAIKNEKLFDSTIEAWAYGPVVPGIYRRTKKYGTLPIDSLIINVKVIGINQFKESIPCLDKEKDAEVIEFLEEIWGTYGKYSGIRLSNSTHLPGTPWREVAGQFNFNIPNAQDIPDATIKEYFDILNSRGNNAS